MKTFVAWSRRAAVALVSLSLAGAAWSQEMSLLLTGEAEVPPVKGTARGNGKIKVDADKTITGSVAAPGVPATMAHIHEGAPGSNGPVAIPLVRGDKDTWTVPAGTKLTDAQYEAFKAGKLYVNVHTAAHPGGELRAQLKP